MYDCDSGYLLCEHDYKRFTNEQLHKEIDLPEETIEKLREITKHVQPLNNEIMDGDDSTKSKQDLLIIKLLSVLIKHSDTILYHLIDYYLRLEEYECLTSLSDNKIHERKLLQRAYDLALLENNDNEITSTNEIKPGTNLEYLFLKNLKEQYQLKYPKIRRDLLNAYLQDAKELYFPVISDPHCLQNSKNSLLDELLEITECLREDINNTYFVADKITRR